MPRKRSIRRMVTTILGLLIAVPAAVITVASPAFANGDRCCQVSIGNLPAQFSGGGNPETFTLHVVNQTQQTFRYLSVSFILQANELVGDLVHLQRQRFVGGLHSVGTFTQHGVHSGVVTANDQIDLGAAALRPATGVNIQYQLSFNKKTPGSGLALSVHVQARRNDGGVSSAGPYQSTIVAAGQPTQTQPATPAPTPTPTDTPAAVDTAGVGAAPTDHSSLVGGAPSSGGGGSLLWLAYTIGALFVLGGIGLIGTLRWRRGPHGFETDGSEPRLYGQPTYPTSPLGVHEPTRVTPSVYGAPGRHTAPTAQFPAAQVPFVEPDQTWVDPPAGR